MSDTSPLTPPTGPQEETSPDTAPTAARASLKENADAVDSASATSAPKEEISAENAAAGDTPSEEAALEEAAAWGSPWGAAEAGWDGEEPVTAPGGATPPPPPPHGETPAAPDAGDAAPALREAAPPAASAPAKEEEPAPEVRPMSLMEHLGELRTRLIRCCIAVALAFMACYSVADILFKELCRPLVEAMPPGSKLIFTALPEAFFVYLQVAFVAAIFMASPYIFYQIWAFIAPGLYEEEKQHMLPIAGFSAFFFIVGAAFCYLVVFPFAFSFFIGFATEDIAAMPSLSEYLGFALKLLIAFGLIFEMPLFAFFLARMGIITAELMRRVRRYAILVIFIVAAILTPPDVMSQMLMAIPMLVLYEFSIFVAAMFGKKRKPTQEETEEPQKETA